MKFNLCIVGRDMDGVKGEEGEKKKQSQENKTKQKYTTGYQNLHIKKKKKGRKEP